MHRLYDRDTCMFVVYREPEVDEIIFAVSCTASHVNPVAACYEKSPADSLNHSYLIIYLYIAYLYIETY